MNYYGVIHADRTYTDIELATILRIDKTYLLDYYKAGLKFFQKTRKQPRQIAGSEYHRFISENSKSWPEDESVDAA